MLNLKESGVLNIFKKILRWSILALAIEFAVFFYIDRFYLKEIKTFNVKTVDLKKPKIKKVQDVSIPSNAKNICVSYDGKYAAYILDGEVTVIDRVTGKFIYVTLASSTMATKLEWLPDRNRMYIVEKGNTYVKFSSYDAAKNENIQWGDDNGKDIIINLASPRYEVKDFVFSVNNNSAYVNIGGASRSMIYRIGIQKEVTKVKDLYDKIGSIGMTQLDDDRLIYEDLSLKYLYVEGYTTKFKDSTIQDPCFLSTDFDNVVYIGSRSGGKINKIFYGNLEDPLRSWESVALPSLANKEDIYVTSDGTIYYDDALNGKVTDLKTNKSSTYDGQLIKIYSNGIATLDGNTLKDTKLN